MKIILTILLLWSTVYGQDVPMKEYVDMQVEMLLKVSDIRYANIEKNVSLANASMDKRLDGMNEFRQSLKDSNATFITKSELVAWIVAAAGLFWGYSKHQREKKEAEGNEKIIHSGDKVEVKK